MHLFEECQVNWLHSLLSDGGASPSESEAIAGEHRLAMLSLSGAGEASLQAAGGAHSYLKLTATLSPWADG